MNFSRYRKSQKEKRHEAAFITCNNREHQLKQDYDYWTAELNKNKR